MRSVEPLSEEQARKRILEALDIEVHPSAEMSDDLRARILANAPSAEEIGSGRWNDETLQSLERSPSRC